MASIFGHGMVGYTIAKVSKDTSLTLLVFLAVLSAIIPDIDVIGFYMGLDYESMFGHRGFTHSILFALIWALILTLLSGRNSKLLWYLVIFGSTISHGILDAMTNGGRGVGFFIPFSDERIFFPFRFILVSPLGIERFFSNWGLQVIINEIKYIILPCLIILGVNFLFKKIKK